MVGGSGDAAIERLSGADGRYSGADHDLGRHTTDIDAGAADGAARSISVTRAPCSTASCRMPTRVSPLPMTAIYRAAATRSCRFAQQIAHLARINPPGVETEGHRPAWPDNRVQLQRRQRVAHADLNAVSLALPLA
ncbi:hypothetical protein KCP77_24920 (plasmid) [Salmonella enterica subsp. enterica]|nr:hypothetical protein KCP77_24920 [Salmonella enterica subsp. enterica]